MGCGASKIDTELVKLCRERKELIRAARDSRDSLAISHMVYLQSMQNVENELKNFMEEAIAICFNLASDAGLDNRPVEAVPNSESSSLESNNNEDDDDDLLSLNDHVNPSETQPENESGQVRPLDNIVFPPHGNEISIGDSAYRASSSSGLANSFRPSQVQTLMPSGCTRSSESNFGFNSDANGASFGSQTNYVVSNSMFFQHERGAPQHYVMDIPSDNAEHYQPLFSHPSSPLHHEVSTWDYINPFNVVEDTFLNFYSQGSYEVNSVSNDMDLRELGESEGIPELEDELDEPIMDDTSGEGYLDINGDSEECLSEEAALKDGDDDYPDQKEEVRSTGDGLTNIRDEKIDGTGIEDLESGPTSSASPSSSASEILKVEEIKESQTCDGEEDSFHKEMEKSKTCERQHSSSQTDETVAEFMSKMSVNSSSDLQVLTEIKDAFNNIIMHGKDVSEMLGPYQPGIALTKGSCPSCIERLAVSSRETSARRSTDRMLKMAKEASESLENETSMTLYNLSLTLEKLCIWENKLYEEVKNEEKLREDFDNEWRKLKKLDDKGAESSKVDASQLALKGLTPRINVSISTVEGIATRTHKIRDEELHPQLCELIQRMHIMWKFMFESHKKQVQAITKVQANVVTTRMASDSSLKATQKLEAGIQNLGTAFSDWIKSHKAFALLLKNWLTKFLLQEPEKSPGATNPSGSPSINSLSTPIVFAICNDWHNAVERVSETDVLLALNNFKQLLHQLCLDMHEEGRQRIKIEYLSSYHEKKLRNFCVQNGLDWDPCPSFIREADSTIETGFSSLHALYVNLRPIRIKLAEADAKHEEVMKRVNAAAASILQKGLAPLLEALESFSLDLFNAFEQIRIPNEAGTQGVGCN